MYVFFVDSECCEYLRPGGYRTHSSELLHSFLTAVLVTAGVVSIRYAGIRASISLHYSLLVNLLRAPLSLFDTTPVGRVLNRFAKDVHVIDNSLVRCIQAWLSTTLWVFGSICILAYTTPMILLPLLAVTMLYTFVQVSVICDVFAYTFE